MAGGNGDAGTHYNLANELYEKNDLDGAIAEHREATRLNPNYSEAHSNLGAALGNKGDLNGTIAEWREALRLDPNNAVAQKYLDQALKELPK